jgi:branched-subunit amino acid transport protein
MTTGKLIGFIVLLALTAYIPRMLPMALLRKRITHPFLQSFLLYMPYAILGAMLVPDMLFSTGSVYSALAGCAVAAVLAYRRKGLLPVALAATAAVFIVEQLMALFF